MASVIIQEQVSVPLDLRDLAAFRRWAHSRDFPETGRIDYIRGDIEVDMSPEDLFSHGTLKGEIYATLLSRVKQRDLGHLFTDSTRVSHVDADLSVEPDIVFISFRAIDERSVQLVPKASGAADRYVEIEGAPDLVVEVVSDTSVRKDTQRLLAAYHQAQVPEYWVVDAHGQQLVFQIYERGATGFQSAAVAADGFQESKVMNCLYRLERHRTARGYWHYDLQQRDQSDPGAS